MNTQIINISIYGILKWFKISNERKPNISRTKFMFLLCLIKSKLFSEMRETLTFT